MCENEFAHFPLPSLSFGSTESSSMAQEIVLPIGGSGGKICSTFHGKTEGGAHAGQQQPL